MGEAKFRFYAELNDFLPPERRYHDFAYNFLDIATVKDRIESFGVPHTEVDLIIVNGDPVPFTYRVKDGDRISVYPVFEAFDITPANRLRPEPLRIPRFVLDVHLGRLAAYLRMAGFDTFYRNCYSDEQLAGISHHENRILLTRDVGLLKRSAVTHGYFVRETNVEKQLAEIVKRFELERLVKPFTRCMICNGALQDVPPESVQNDIPPKAAELYHDFRRCAVCRKVYWKGAHYRRMRKLMESFGLYSE